MHYRRWRTHGDPLTVAKGGRRLPEPVSVRFWSRVDKTADCWLWTGSINSSGYGVLHIDRRPVRAHRLAYEELVGPIPYGLALDHLCRVRNCVRPDHLEPVTLGENVLRGVSPSAVNRRKTHCPQGHPFNETNTYRRSGRRVCRECSLEWDRRARERKRALA
jgi:hypothetical protein